MNQQVSTNIGSTLVCAGCGAEMADVPPSPVGPCPFRCSRARTGDDIDHVVTRVLNPAAVRFPHDFDANPFVAYRTLFHSHHLAIARGMRDDDYVDLVRRLDEEVAAVEGTPAGFLATPFGRHVTLSDEVDATRDGGIWIKDETRNVSGSHKGRHLMGIMIHLRVMDALGLAHPPAARLAIASCGNAALAAAVVARAGGRDLDVFIPRDAPASVVDRLRTLGARTIVCEREPGAAGDPCYRRFEQAVEHGAIPFCCQGPANGLTIEGGETLGYEMVAALGATSLDVVIVQVGGGALASAVIQSFLDAKALGAIARLPRFYTVQTRGAFPLKRAYDRLLERIGGTNLRASLDYAATHRHEFMWPWEDEPRSLARGILDDETYDWLAVVKGMVESGGTPVVVDEQGLVDAYALARGATGVDVDHTGAAGLAGLLQLRRDGAVAPDEKVAIVFSGVRRN